MTTVPLSATDIRLMSGVPFSNDYKNTRWFDTKTQQTNYFLAKPTTYADVNHNFQRIEGRHFVKVKKHIDSLWGTNYMMFQNSEYGSRWFYAFVTKLEYENKDYTKVYFQIDVFQTWKFDMNFKPSFVVREHCKLWNDDNTPVINTIDEGLNYGEEYETVSVENYAPNGDLLFLVIVTKETMHSSANVTAKQITPTFNGMPQPLTYYIHPFRRNGTVPNIRVGGTPKELSEMGSTLKNMFLFENAVNNIVSLYVTEYIGKPVAYDGTTVDFDSFSFDGATITQDGVSVDTVFVKNILEYVPTGKDMGNKYTGFTTNTESKLFMYPYTMTILDDFKGNRTVIKNEYIKGSNLEIQVKGSLGTSNKVAYTVDNYLSNDYLDYAQDNIKNIETGIINDNPNDISILNDYLSAYLQGNKNTIANQKMSAMFNGMIGSISGGLVGTAQSMHYGAKGSLYANPIGLMAAGAEVVSGTGNAILQMEGINAKIKDANNTPSQLVKMGGNSAFDFGNGYTGLYVVKKQIKAEYRQILTDFFNMFGYKVNRVKVPNFHTRQNWNYVQTLNCNILGNMNNDDLVSLKSVFDNGITFWHTDDVGNYALTNEVI